MAAPLYTLKGSSARMWWRSSPEEGRESAGDFWSGVLRESDAYAAPPSNPERALDEYYYAPGRQACDAAHTFGPRIGGQDTWAGRHLRTLLRG